MLAAKGFFINNVGNRVSYEIDENVTKHIYSLHFTEIGSIYHYTRRRDEFNIEVEKKDIYIEPKYQRDLDEFKELIEEFYKENSVNAKSSPFFSCSITKDGDLCEMKVSTYQEEKVNKYLEDIQVDKKDLAKYIYINKKSPYSRS